MPKNRKPDHEATLDRVMQLVFKLDMAEPWNEDFQGQKHFGRMVARAMADDIREAMSGNPRKQGLHTLNRLGLIDYSIKPKRLKKLLKRYGGKSKKR